MKQKKAQNDPGFLIESSEKAINQEKNYIIKQHHILIVQFSPQSYKKRLSCFLLFQDHLMFSYNLTLCNEMYHHFN